MKRTLTDSIRPHAPTSGAQRSALEESRLGARLGALRKTSAATNLHVDDLLTRHVLTQDSLAHVVNWCCAAGEADLLDEVLRLAAEHRLTVPTVWIAAESDEHTANALEVLAMHPSVKAINLFRRENNGVVLGAVIGPTAVGVLGRVLVGTPDHASNLTHLGVVAPRVESAGKKAFVATLGRAVAVAPKLRSFTLDCDAVSIEQLVLLSACACRNQQVSTFALTLPVDGLRRSDGRLLAQSVITSRVRDLMLRCDDAQTLTACLEHLAEAGSVFSLSTLTLQAATANAEPASQGLYVHTLKLIQQTSVLAVKIEGIQVEADEQQPLRNCIDAVVWEDAASGEADVESPADVPALECALVLFDWPDSGLGREHLAYVNDAARRNQALFKEAFLSDRFAAAVGWGFAVTALGNSGDSMQFDSVTIGMVGKVAAPFASIRDLLALASVNRSAYNAARVALSRELGEMFERLISAQKFDELHDLVVKVDAAGLGLVQAHSEATRQLAHANGIDFHVPMLPMLQPS